MTETKKILKSFEHDSRVKIVNVPKGDGASTNWNYVSELATGEYFKLLPHDDILKSDMIQRQVELLNVNPKIGMTSSKREIISDHGEILKSNWGLDGIKHLTDGREVVRATIKKGRNVVGEPGSVLMRKSIFDQIGGILTSAAGITARDSGLSNNDFMSPNVSSLFNSFIPNALGDVTNYWGGNIWRAPIFITAQQHKQLSASTMGDQQSLQTYTAVKKQLQYLVKIREMFGLLAV
ncbi:hypothetical protein Pfo_031466 [Paulownia fortunei]|nr:hypothetical protein Pfo_031466 [Paulownia fortunei]